MHLAGFEVVPPLATWTDAPGTCFGSSAWLVWFAVEHPVTMSTGTTHVMNFHGLPRTRSDEAVSGGPR